MTPLHLSQYENHSKNIKKTPQRQYSGNNTPLGHHTDCSPVGLGQYDGIGEYCGPSTASSMFLILVVTAAMNLARTHRVRAELTANVSILTGEPKQVFFHFTYGQQQPSINSLKVL